jgi:transcriptional regulator with GAF, ATPase, and Fis domain
MTESPAKALKDCLLRIYSSKDLRMSIRALYSFCQDYFPIDFMTMIVYDIEQNMIHYRTHSTDDAVLLFANELIRFSEDAKEEALDLINSNIRTLYIPNGQTHSIVREYNEQVGINHPASIICRGVEVNINQYAILCIVVWEEDRYNSKNVNLINQLSEQIDSAIRHIYSQMIIARLRERIASENREAKKKVLNTADGATGLRDVLSRIEQVAMLDTPVLLMGETGVGKELLANTIHNRSKRKEGPLISINCGAIAETLLDSELFGHEKGAFTGAGSLKIGFFEQANGGTIFLDEVSELSKQAQVKLLRVLQNMTFQRVGGQRAISVDVRVVAATNRDIAKMVENKEFRKDLWFRLNIFPITIPPLRARKGDIPELAEYFAKCLSVEMNLPYRYRFAPHAMEQLQRYNWPGNVRELENVIEHALILSHGAPLSFPHLDAILPESKSAPPGEDHSRALTMNEMMKRHIISVLNLTHGKIEGRGGAAEILNMKPSTLRSRMRKLGVKVVKFPDNILTL